MRRYYTLSSVIADVIIYLVIAFCSLVCILPLMNTLAISLSAPAAVDAGWVSFWPVQFTFDAYETLLEEKAFFTSFFVSVRRVIVGVTINLFFVVIMAYPMSRSRKEFPQRPFYLAILLFTMLFGAALIPWYLTIRDMHLINSFWAMIIPSAVGTGNIVMMMNFFRNTPRELEEAAMVDGAGPFRILWSIYLPISTAGVATIALFSGLGHWNNYFDGLILINSPEKMPLQSYVQQFVVRIDAREALTYEELMEAAKLNNRTLNAAKLFITMAPVLAIYPFLQRYFTKGIVIGAVKG